MCRLLHEAGRPELAAQASECNKVGIGQLLRDGQAPTWPKDTPNLPECLRAARNFTQDSHSQDVVKGVGCEGEILAPGLNRPGTLEACGTESAMRLEQHLALNVQTDQSPPVTDATRSFQGVIACAGSDLEHALPGLQVKRGKDARRTEEERAKWEIQQRCFGEGIGHRF